MFYSAGLIDAIPASGLQHEYDARELSSTASFIDVVNNNDLPGNGDPSLVGSGIGGKQVVEYDGVGDFHHGVGAGMSTPGPYTFAFVIKTLSDVTSVQCVGGQSNVGSFRTDIESGSWKLVHGGVGSASGGTITTNTVYVGVQTYDGSTATLQIGTTDVVSTAIGALNRSDEMSLAATPEGAGSEAEIQMGHALFYNEYYDSAGRDDIIGGLEDEWGITSADG